ncbi:maltooligosyl trehalose synthase [Variibacter gotjawalensis]|uniref:Maltooligosyl trehalose synthase n=1 Tax=Variibacter gotjawalensis TaxID=1333996 RepID=A0A0S3PSG6_9BRAD|nr:malto-oligosyltrehalose synthase [Variibacter gotjawalensis]NIK49162.1 (1->4)-alpha-D-glucan 1-alpha-D-glucosylmutase [Variibacter gotjawalensis]RZS51018.1 maltooligosyl trehalose synthase [Variibacter gotjawalensis]BAT58852.1 maltooligosyl trehalose synthase [Variibacter gotjawalensis]
MPPRIPVATYRVQLTKDFDFDAAASLVPYLKDLGISHLYASPFLKARPGSTHGYDIVDHNQLNPELGGEAGFVRLSDALAAADMGLILDFVPNHMGIGLSDNAWWLDVLEWGQQSPYAASFDIDWTGLPHRNAPGVLLPILGKAYGDVLRDGEIELRYDAETGSFAAWYYEHKLPINPQRYGELLRTLVTAASAHDIEAGQAMITLAQRSREREAPTYDDAKILKRDLAAIPYADAIIARGLSEAYSAGNETGRLALHRLLERQNYRIAYWRVAFSAINYRRFFDINDLAGLRAEHPATFRLMHGLVAQLIAEDRLHGIRLDHIDGLHDPAQYARRLREMIRRVTKDPRRNFYVVIEKILGHDEPLPHFSGVAGTTGYERLNVIMQAFLDLAGLPSLEETWRDFTGERATFVAMLAEAKQIVITTMLASEFTVLARALSRIAAGNPATRDYTLDRIRAALQAYTIEFPVYRTYIARADVSDADRILVDAATERARDKWRGPDPEIFDFLRDAITLDIATKPGYSPRRARAFALRLQQFTGPLMAKALEDTTFYRYHRLVALNEVGGEPAHPATSLDEFHANVAALAKAAPHGMTATATHDTKRGEDARMRILALSELAPEWRERVQTWRAMNESVCREAGEPSRAHEYMLYQALIGAWPDKIDADFVARMEGYAVKAMREGKQQTSWTNTNETYERKVIAFLHAVLDRKRSAAFLDDFAAFAERTSFIGALSSLSQLALKILLPGIPDFFQGTEFWDTSLVDPDNRRAVDYHLRRARLADDAPPADFKASLRDGSLKFWLTRKLLQIRNDSADLFRDGTYEPIDLSEEAGDNVVGFKRSSRHGEIAIVVGRHFAQLTNGGKALPQAWKGETPVNSAEDLLWGGTRDRETLSFSQLFHRLPVAVLRIK